MTCKDCIHNVICVEKAREYNERFVDYGEKCQDFSDNSKCIKLPFKVGDTLWDIEKQKISVVSIKISTDAYRIYVKYENGHISWYFESEIGESIFLTLEEAEKAWKENGGEQE